MDLSIPLTDEEAAALMTAATRSGCTVGDVARVAIREYLHRPTLTEKVDDALDVLTPRYSEVLGRLGS